jgi:protein-disulfide isomerase
MKTIGRIPILAALAMLPACAPDYEDVKRGDKEILAKIDAVTESLKKAGGGGQGGGDNAPDRPEPDMNKVYDIALDTSPVRGPREARVTIIEFSDFQCPFCGEARSLIDDVLKAYPKDVRLVFKHFPLTSIHPNALPAALATVAAGHQGKFWEMHDIVFTNNRELEYDKLKGYADQIGLNVHLWEEDFQAQDVRQQITRDVRAARAADVDATPTFFVNGKRVGDRTMENFKRLVDEALATPKRG